MPCANRLFHSPVGKTECWHFLPGTAPDACVYLGFKPGVTRAAWELIDQIDDRQSRSPTLRGAEKIVFGELARFRSASWLVGYTELTCATASVCALRQTFGETECRSLKRRRKYDGEA